MHAIHGLLWEQWRQTRYWIVGTCAFLLMLTAAMALYRPWLLKQFSGDLFPLDKFAWAIGFTLIGMLFVNQRMRDVSLHFPGRLFALPCRTMPLVASQLLYKSAIAILLGLLISLYQWLLLDRESPSALPVLFFLALVALSQALVLLATVAGSWPAIGAGTVWLSAALGCYYLLPGVGLASDSAAALVVATGTTVVGWGVSLACAPAARHGSRRGPIGWSVPMPAALRISMPLHLQWNFTSPAWAHAWYEWRRVTVWTVGTVVPATAVLTLLTLRGVNDVMALLTAFGIALAAALSCSYFLLRVSPSERRFLLAQPGGERALVNGKLLAALFASLGAAVLSACVMVLLCLLAIMFGQGRMGVFLLGGVPSVLLSLAGLLWIALTSAPIYFFAVLVGWILFFCFMAPVSLALALGADELLVATTCCIVVTLLLFAAWRGLRARGIPVPWELSLALLGFTPALNGVFNFYFASDSSSPKRVEDQIGFLLPLFLLSGALLFARRIGLISRARAMLALAGHGLVSVAFFAVYLWGFQLGPLTELDTVFWWIAACFAPVVWVPLAVRLQRYR